MIRVFPGLFLRIQELTVDLDLEDASTRRDQGEFFDRVLELF